MGLKISPEEAMKKLDEVKSHRDQAKQVLTNFRDTNVQMTGGAWQGDASRVHLQKSDVNDQEFDQIIALLDRTVDAAETGIRNALSADSNA
ncbi:hypothetical protein [Gordonia bronchialis]|jgi:uncharacterized protein YukE|uniref:hypothetical protein n=1 Tax=Gordonia bronchialis TaxID=2054 RepID=UPI0024317796|nr:hypothetical protein [Gordonia bronchialis]